MNQSLRIILLYQWLISLSMTDIKVAIKYAAKLCEYEAYAI